tara:strand:- start:314 stop:565 length:252 start_codon:yes stop_codon:yes gene_type:complete
METTEDETMGWIPATAGFQLDEEIIDPATGETWIVLNVGVVRDEDTFLHLMHKTKKLPGLKVQHPAQRGCFVNRTTGEHTRAH